MTKTYLGAAALSAKADELETLNNQLLAEIGVLNDTEATLAGMWEGAAKEQMAPYLAAVDRFAKMFARLYEKGKRDGTLDTSLPEEKMFAATSHIMLAVAVRYAQGLLYSADNEEDRTEEYELLKRMILREYVTTGT